MRGGVDIRTMGSGNAGGTNALRTQGLLFALGVVIIDIGKGVIGAGVVPELNIPFVPEDPMLSRTWLAICCAAAAVLGHVWPIFHGFKGGKGVATAFGVILGLSLPVAVAMLIVWLSVYYLFKISSLGALSTALVTPLFFYFLDLSRAQVINHFESICIKHTHIQKCRYD